MPVHQPCNAHQSDTYEMDAVESACLLAYLTHTFKTAVFISFQTFRREAIVNNSTAPTTPDIRQRSSRRHFFGGSWPHRGIDYMDIFWNFLFARYYSLSFVLD